MYINLSIYQPRDTGQCCRYVTVTCNKAYCDGSGQEVSWEKGRLMRCVRISHKLLSILPELTIERQFHSYAATQYENYNNGLVGWLASRSVGHNILRRSVSYISKPSSGHSFFSHCTRQKLSSPIFNEAPCQISVGPEDTRGVDAEGLQDRGHAEIRETNLEYDLIISRCLGALL